MNAPLEQTRGGARELVRFVPKTHIPWPDPLCVQLVVQTKDLLRVRALPFLATANQDLAHSTDQNARFVAMERFREGVRSRQATTQRSSARRAKNAHPTKTLHREAQKGQTASAFRDTEIPTTTQTTEQHAAHAKTASMHLGGTTLLAFHVALELLLNRLKLRLRLTAVSAMHRLVSMKRKIYLLYV